MAGPPRPPKRLDPLGTVLPSGTRLFRVHSQTRAANDFNPGTGKPTRFHPLADDIGRPVPTLYAAATAEAALAESVFHDVPVRRSRGAVLVGTLLARDDLVLRGLRVVSYKRRVKGAMLTPLALLRDLSLVQLYDAGLDRLGVTAGELTAGPPKHYPRAREWAAALHRLGFDGLIWMSRRRNSAQAVVLFGDRVEPGDLRVDSPSLPLDEGAGRALVYELAEHLGIMVSHD